MFQNSRQCCTEVLPSQGVPFAVINRGPSFLPLNTRYGSNALTGQTVCSVAPRKRWIPCRKGSVFDCLIVTRTSDGSTILSMAISLIVR